MQDAAAHLAPALLYGAAIAPLQRGCLHHGASHTPIYDLVFLGAFVVGQGRGDKGHSASALARYAASRDAPCSTVSIDTCSIKTPPR